MKDYKVAVFEKKLSFGRGIGGGGGMLLPRGSCSGASK